MIMHVLARKVGTFSKTKQPSLAAKEASWEFIWRKHKPEDSCLIMYWELDWCKMQVWIIKVAIDAIASHANFPYLTRCKFNFSLLFDRLRDLSKHRVVYHCWNIRRVVVTVWDALVIPGRRQWHLLTVLRTVYRELTAHVLVSLPRVSVSIQCLHIFLKFLN